MIMIIPNSMVFDTREIYVVNCIVMGNHVASVQTDMSPFIYEYTTSMEQNHWCMIVICGIPIHQYSYLDRIEQIYWG